MSPLPPVVLRAHSSCGGEGEGNSMCKGLEEGYGEG